MYVNDLFAYNTHMSQVNIKYTNTHTVLKYTFLQNVDLVECRNSPFYVYINRYILFQFHTPKVLKFDQVKMTFGDDVFLRT